MEGDLEIIYNSSDIALQPLPGGQVWSPGLTTPADIFCLGNTVITKLN